MAFLQMCVTCSCPVDKLACLYVCCVCVCVYVCVFTGPRDSSLYIQTTKDTRHTSHDSDDDLHLDRAQAELQSAVLDLTAEDQVGALCVCVCVYVSVHAWICELNSACSVSIQCELGCKVCVVPSARTNLTVLCCMLLLFNLTVLCCLVLHVAAVTGGYDSSTTALPLGQT